MGNQTPKFSEWRFQCEACLKDRLAIDIDVLNGEIQLKSRAKIIRSVNYCMDDPSCINRAKEILDEWEERSKETFKEFLPDTDN